MKNISKKWAVDIDKLKVIAKSITQPVNFRIDNKEYVGMSLGPELKGVICHPDLWVKQDNTSIDLRLEVTDPYATVSNELSIDYAYPVYYGTMEESKELQSPDFLEELLLSKPEFEINSYNVPDNHYLYICIPKAYDTGKLLFTINDAFGGIYLYNELEFCINGYVPVDYNIYRSVNTSLGNLHIIVAERGLQECLFMSSIN